MSNYMVEIGALKAKRHTSELGTKTSPPPQGQRRDEREEGGATLVLAHAQRVESQKKRKLDAYVVSLVLLCA